MTNNPNLYTGHATATSRWSRFGPYYAMFPIDFTFGVIDTYSEPGDSIIDPFSGRGSSVFAGSVLGRKSYGIEINPIGWIYSKVKLSPADKNDVLNKLKEIDALKNNYKTQIDNCSEFFKMCYCNKVLMFLLAAKDNLDWKHNKIDRTLMSFLMVYLHGAIGEGLSNQMKMTKSMGVQYSINWWKNNGFENPPEINPYEFMQQRINWRYSKGIPKVSSGNVILGDSCKQTQKMLGEPTFANKFSLLFTSPPYMGVTNYFADQWLRLWLLGGEERPVTIKDEHKGRFNNKEEYKKLLSTVFGNCAQMMKEKSTVYVRTDVRNFTFQTTLDVLKEKFPDYAVEVYDKPVSVDKVTQTLLYGNTSSEQGEKDIILRRG